MLDENGSVIENEDTELSQKTVAYETEGFFIEINNINLADVSGRTRIKMSAHEIYGTDSQYNENGLTWTENSTRENIESAIGMPYVAVFPYGDNEIPFDHGEQVYDEEGNVSFPESVQVGSVQKAYIEEVNGKKLLMTEGYLSNQRYPKFIKWLKTVIKNEDIKGSVEINGKEGAKQIVYENGRTNEDGSLKMGRKPSVYDYTGLAILYGQLPADETSQIIELNSKKDDNNKEEYEMEFKELYEKEVAKNKELEIEINSSKEAVTKLEASIVEKDETIVNANRVVVEKETALEALTKEHSEINTEYEKLIKEKAEAEVNSYFESIKNVFEEEELTSLKTFAENCDLVGLKAKESEICTAKFKALKSKETKTTKTDTETNTVVVVKTEEIDAPKFESLSDIK